MTDAALAPSGAPYVGLRPFEFDEAHLFYGRGEHIAEMARTLRRQHLLSVVGSSGSGKSSLVRAGLLPAIADGVMDRGEDPNDWRFAVMRPGLDPYGNLLGALLSVLAPDHRDDAELVRFREQTLRSGPLGLVDMVSDCLLPLSTRLIVLVDQFEEIFRFLERQGPALPNDGHSGGERRNDALAFVDMLLATVERRHPQVIVVVTMRSEYLGECEAFLGLSSAIARSQFLTPRMTRDQIQDIIERPIAAAGGRVDPQVVTDLLNALGTAQDQLPRVSHVLLRMWGGAQAAATSSGSGAAVQLTPADYRGAGGFESALDQHAEQLYLELSDGAESGVPSLRQRVAERLCCALATRSPQGSLVRRLSSVSEVASVAGASEAVVISVVEHFRQNGANFLVAGRSADSAHTALDISHEALLRQWRRLGQWLEDEAKSADIYRRIAETAELHAAGNAGLWRDPELQHALEWRDRQHPTEIWASRYHPGFAPALEFLQASMTLRDGEALGLDANLIERLTRLGYRLDSRIGRPEDHAYKAHQVSDGRTVAVTILADVGDDDAARSALERMAPVRHTGLVDVHAVHDEENPTIVVTQWLDGRPVTRELETADWNTVAAAMAAICDALDEAHRHGVVHGRLTPARLLIGPDGLPTVLDVETRRLATRDGALQVDLADPTAAPYTAPELIEGRSPIAPACDVYSLGAVLYELLAGTPPFARVSLRDTLDAHLYEAPELPTLRRDDVPEPLQRICLKALEKSPAERYGSLAEMRDDLRRYRRGEAVAVRPSYYNNLMESPARAHVAEVDRWRQQNLITDGEYVRLRQAYQGLTRSGLQAISESRLVHWRVSLLYLGGWLVLTGAALWLELHYADKGPNQLGLANWRSGRMLIGLVPTLLTNGLWWYYHGLGSYRYGFAAMVLGLLSLPFAVGVTVHEISEQLGVLKAVTRWSADDQIFGNDGWVNNIQLFIALSAAVGWGVFVSRQSWTRTSATILGLHALAWYLTLVDFWGLKYFFWEHVSYGGVVLLPASALLIAAGMRVARLVTRSSQAVPFFALAMVVTILASQAIALKGPEDREWGHAQVWTGAIEVVLGLGYFALSRVLQARFKVDAVAAYRLFAWLAPIAVLGGLAWMDLNWTEGEDPLPLKHYLGFDKQMSPVAPLLLVSSIGAVMVATWVQSYFYISCGLVFLAYVLDVRIGSEEPFTWPWPLSIMVLGLTVVSVMRWLNTREQLGEDIDDVGESLIQQSRRSVPPSRR